jgi:hypothetical protein
VLKSQLVITYESGNILVNREQKKMESEIWELLDAVERTMGLYFYDISLTL